MTWEERIRLRNSENGRRNRLNGEAFEFKVLAKEKRSSLFAVRSAGSHSLVDIVSRKKTGQIWYISCKRNGYFTSSEVNALKQLKESLSANEHIKLVYYVSSKKWVYRGL